MRFRSYWCRAIAWTFGSALAVAMLSTSCALPTSETTEEEATGTVASALDICENAGSCFVVLMNVRGGIEWFVMHARDGTGAIFVRTTIVASGTVGSSGQVPGWVAAIAGGEAIVASKFAELLAAIEAAEAAAAAGATEIGGAVAGLSTATMAVIVVGTIGIVVELCVILNERCANTAGGLIVDPLDLLTPRPNDSAGILAGRTCAANTAFFSWLSRADQCRECCNGQPNEYYHSCNAVCYASFGDVQ